MQDNQSKLRKLVDFSKNKDLALFEAVDEASQNIAAAAEVFGKLDIEKIRLMKGEKGDPGLDGRDGIDGIDGRDGIDGQDGKDGAPGRDGKDGETPDIEEVAQKAATLIPLPANGRDGKDGENGSPDSAEEIREKLKSLKGNSRLPASAIKDLEQWFVRVSGSGNSSSSSGGTGVLIATRVYQTGTTSLNTTWASLAFAAESFDTDGLHDNVTNNSRITIGTAGKYAVGGNLLVNSNAVTGCRVILNGTTVICRQNQGNSGSEEAASCSGIYDLVAGDYIELQGRTGSAQNSSGDAQTNFWCYQLNGGGSGSGSSGTVTSTSVVSANGFAGTVATATTTPAITLSTTITGMLKGNGTAISAATAETDYVTPTGAGTLSSKRITARIGTEASSATSTPTADTVDQWNITALAAADAIAAPTGTPNDGQRLTLRIKDNGTARALTWNAIYRAGTDVALPTTTVVSKTMYVGFIYNAADSKWDLVALTNNI